ncbi:MAG: hypothetical protein NTX89_00045 [Candidatus Omnitrophica bacterium]|nr:hypothetical protein [Candidatus Omnitrophota bacterium]
MTSKWETEDSRILKFMNISPKKKLQWLYEINRFLTNFSSGKINKIRQKLREF